MTENAKIILLNSEHYDAQKVIDKMQGEEGFETLKISKEALSELVDKSRAENEKFRYESKFQFY